MLDLAFRPDAGSRDPVYRQLADHLAALIVADRLAPGERLPPTRELAEALGVARNTVSRAYEWLAEAGYLGAHVGRGTFVAGGPRPRSAALRPGGPRPAPFAWSALLAPRRLQLPRRPPMPGAGPSALRFDFRPGVVDTRSLPIAELQGAWQRAVGKLREHGNDFDALGWPPLRAAIARSLTGRGIARSADEVLVTSGAQQAIELVARALIEPGDVVAVEDPGYFLAALAFRGCGARVVGIGVDAEGLRTDELARVLRTRRVKLVYVTPSVQLPTGVSLSAERREMLLDLSDRAQMPILEDDYDCELRTDAPAAPALKASDGRDRVIYVGTFSKALFPGLRVGYVVGAPELLRVLAVGRTVSTLQASLVDQIAMAELLARDGLERHVRRVRKRYAERARTMLAALAEYMPAETRFREPAGGCTVWVELPENVDAGVLAAAAAGKGIAYAPGAPCRIDGDGPPALLLSHAVHGSDAIRTGVAELAALVRQQLPRAGGRSAFPPDTRPRAAAPGRVRHVRRMKPS